MKLLIYPIWALSLLFCLQAVSQVTIYNHNFDDRIGFTTDQSFCDAAGCATNDNRWGINSNPSCVSGFTGSTFYARDINSCGTDATEILVFPNISVIGNGDVIFEALIGFDNSGISFSGTNTVTFEYSFTSAAGPWSTGSIVQTNSASSMNCTNCDITGNLTSDVANFITFNMGSGNAASTLFLRMNVSGFDGAQENFFLDDVEIIEQCESPTIVASGLSFSAINSSSMTLNWVNNSGDRVLVTARESSVSVADPSLQTAYIANSQFGLGDITGSGNYAIYDGTSNTVNVTGLTGGEEYTFAVYAYNSSDTCYNLIETDGTQSTSCTTGGPSVGPAKFRTCSGDRGTEVSNSGALSFNIFVGGSYVGNSLDATAGPNIRNIRVKLEGDASDDINGYTCTLTAPDGTTSLVIFGSGSFTNNVANIDAQFRDNSLLRVASYTTYSSMGREPFDQGYYKVIDAGGFGVFDGVDPRGNWTVTFTESLTSTNDDYLLDFVEIEFATPYPTETDVTTLGDNCSAAIALSDGIYHGSTVGKTSEATDPKDNTAGCDGITGCGCWNGAKNNSQWFTFFATKADVEISISGIEYNAISEKRLQAVMLEANPTACSGENNWTVRSCPEASDGGNSYNGPSGTHANIDLSFTAIVGQQYYFIVDGSAGALGNYIIYADGVLPNEPLPVSMTMFEAVKGKNEVNLIWQTVSETNNKVFEIEKSTDGENFTTIKTVAGAGNSTSTIDYKTEDFHPVNGYNYYRLKQIDFDGQYEYSKVSVVDFKLSNIYLFPNMLDQGEIFNLNGVMENASVMIYSINGQLVDSMTLGNENNAIQADYPKGIYIIKLIEGERETNKKLVIR